MGLAGNLEDLGLGDILQIVSLSRKSGILSLWGQRREGKIVFLRGQVVAATSSDLEEDFGDLLLHRGLADRETIERIRLERKGHLEPSGLGAALSDEWGIPGPVLQEVIREQVEKIVLGFFGWTGGAFSFDVGDPRKGGLSGAHPLPFLLPPGVNTQWLAMEGSRLFDEERRCEKSARDEGEGGGPDSADIPPVDCPEGLPIAAERGRPEGGQAEGRAYPSLYDIGADLFRELGESRVETLPGKGAEFSEIHRLKGMLQELHNPAPGGGIVLLVLRFASDLMNRAVFFRVEEKEIVGLGQFGIDGAGENADVRVRQMRIPREAESVFGSVLAGMRPQKTRLGNSRWDTYLMERLGGGKPKEVFLGPIVSEGKAVAIIYGDDLPERKAIGETESLEIFLSQAGLAMEKALLERRLREREAV